MNEQQQPNTNVVSLKEAATALVKHRGLHEGQFELAVTFQLGVGAVASPDDGVTYPSLIGSIVGFELRAVPPGAAAGPHIVDAAVVNPVV